MSAEKDVNSMRTSLIERIITRLLQGPETIDMAEFSRVTDDGPRFCLAGIILDSCGVYMEYGPHGVAVGLEAGETPASELWFDYEASIMRKPFNEAALNIAAKARELWAAEHGPASAKLLPFYGSDWDEPAVDLSALKASDLVAMLQTLIADAGESHIDSEKRHTVPSNGGSQTTSRASRKGRQNGGLLQQRT